MTKKNLQASLVIPVYKNESGIKELFRQLVYIQEQIPHSLEVVFVIDGSPDRSSELISEHMANSILNGKIIEHSRNYGAFAAMRTGLYHSDGQVIAVMAADLQEPPELIIKLYNLLFSKKYDVAVGKRISRKDPYFSKISSNIFWKFYKKFVIRDIPDGGVDIFACTREVSKHLISLNENNTSLIGLLYWLGFRRVEVEYTRVARINGKSSWSIKKKIGYLLDSIFSFSSLPLTILSLIGTIGLAAVSILGILVLFAYLNGTIKEPGYTSLMLVMLLSTFMSLSSLGLVGMYVWRGFENTKGRPWAVVSEIKKF